MNINPLTKMTFKVSSKTMIFTNRQSNKIYDTLYDWLAVHTPGSHSNTCRLNYYQKRIWSPIVNAIIDLYGKVELTEE